MEKSNSAMVIVLSVLAILSAVGTGLLISGYVQLNAMSESFGRIDERTVGNSAELSRIAIAIDSINENLSAIEIRIRENESDPIVLLRTLGVHVQAEFRSGMIDNEIYVFPTNLAAAATLEQRGYNLVAITPEVSGYKAPVAPIVTPFFRETPETDSIE